MTVMQSSFFETHPLDVEHGVLLVLTKRRLTEEENLEQLDRDLITLTDTFQSRNIVLDLSAMTYLTSAAIGKLIALHRRLGRSGGQLVLCELQPDVVEILDTSHLLTYFHVAPNRDAGIAQLA